MQKKSIMKCPKCKQPMRNLGNVSGVVMASYPPQWDIVYVCDKDEVKKTVRERGTLPEPTPDISSYKELKHD